MDDHVVRRSLGIRPNTHGDMDCHGERKLEHAWQLESVAAGFGFEYSPSVQHLAKRVHGYE